MADYSKEILSQRRKRLVKNTLMLYLRTFVLMIISLYSVRVVLSALGVEDYGIQNVVAGFVTMFSFVTGSLSVAISRFLSLEIGSGNDVRLRAVFSSSLQIMVLVSAVIFLLVETVGVWFVNEKMVLSPPRLIAAHWVLQFSALTLVVSLLSVPFDALIISYEKMSAFAFISIFSGVLKLIIAFSIIISPIDKLIFYALLLFLQALIIRCCYGIYCARNFKKVKYEHRFDKSLSKEILSLAGWDLWGSASFVIKNYGVNLVLNLFYGPIVNAARGIALQVNTAVTQFSGGFLTALRPQIIKEYAYGNREALWQMVDSGTKFAIFLLLVISMPLMLECEFVLSLWLGSVPEHTVRFVLLFIILSICEGAMIYTQNAALMANGNIKKCQLITGAIQLLNVPLSYLLLWLDFSPESTIILAIVIANICCFIRSFILSSLTGYSTRRFFTNVYLRVIFVAIIIVLPLWGIRNLMSDGWIRFAVITIASVLWSLVIVYAIGCSYTERHFLTQKIKGLLKL